MKLDLDPSQGPGVEPIPRKPQAVAYLVGHAGVCRRCTQQFFGPEVCFPPAPGGKQQGVSVAASQAWLLQVQRDPGNI